MTLADQLQGLRDEVIAMHFSAEINGDGDMADRLADVMVALDLALDEVRGRVA